MAWTRSLHRAIRGLVTTSVVFSGYASGSVVLDGSLGQGGPLQGPNYVISQTAGRLAGGNLFHSFSTFDIAANESVTFTAFSGANISNVIARVTGGAPSNVNGVLRNAVPNSNFYLINSAGIIFGPSAQLDVPGSFTATTAGYVRFSDSGRFVATLGHDGAFSAAAPAAFGFLTRSPAPINFNGSTSQTLGLSVPAGQSISLVGGGVQIVGGKLLAVGGTINLVAVASPGEVTLANATSAAGSNPPDVSGFATLGPVDLLSGSSLNATVGGRVVIRGAALQLSDSTIDTDTDVVQGGGVDVSVSGALTIDRGRISAETSGTSRGGDIDLTADSILINGLSVDGLAAVSTDTSASGTAGDISLHTGSFSITADGSVTAFTDTSGAGGNISLIASRQCRIDGTGSQFLTGLAVETLSLTDGGPAGNITVDSPRIDLIHQAEITSTTKGSGNGGVISVNTRDLFVDGQNAPTLTGLQARVGKGADDVGATGHGGQINLSAKNITLKNGADITATTFGPGHGGDIAVKSDRVTIVGSPASQFTGFFARSAPDQGNGGPGGNVALTAHALRIAGNASVSALSSGGGSSAGSVKVNAGSIVLSRGAGITVQAEQGTPGGQVTLNAANNLDIFDSTISAQAGGNGRIFIRAGDLVFARRATITARATGAGGGNITIDPTVVVLDHSTIDGRSNQKKVPVRIAADAILLRSDSQILSQSISLPPEADIVGSLTLFAPPVFGTPPLAPQCVAGSTGEAVSSFVITGRGGQPPEPGGWWPDLSLTPPGNDGGQ
jgi:filamentous hemagglutinin family protein